MTGHQQSGRKIPIFVLALVSIITFYGSLHSQGFEGELTPSNVVPLFEPSYTGFQQYFVDSTLFTIRYSRFTRESRLDSSQRFIIFQENLYDRPYRLPVTVELEYYVERRLEVDSRLAWNNAVQKQQQLTRRQGGGGIELNIPVKIKSKTFQRIFGGDRVGLRVSGNISFELAGRAESREGSAISSIENRGTFSPKFKQTQQFRVEGRVGDKVTVSVDQNSEATFDFENTLKLIYDGDEDEIVQKIEAGNVALSLPSTNFVSTTSNNTGLFGLKTEMQVGKFNFIGIASLQRGENENISISGSAREQTFRIKDYEYVDNRFFFMDTVYRENFEVSLNTDQMILELDQSRFIRQLDVWKTTTVVNNTSFNETFEGLAGINPNELEQNPGTELVPGEVEKGRFKRLQEGIDYLYDYQRGYFWLLSQAQNQDIIAVSYLTDFNKVGTLFQEVDTLQVDSTSTDPQIFLKLIKPKGVNNPDFPVWPLTMRNVYNLGASGVTRDGFDARVIYSITGEDQDVDAESGRTYNSLMGMDRLNEQGDVVEGGDKIVDKGQTFIFDFGNGYILFPSLTPFAPGTDPDADPRGKFDFDPNRHVNIYNTTDNTFERQQSKFEIEITTKSVSSTFDLGFNVLEGSEKVRLNGRELARDKDYNIDYFSGQLEITAPEARRADAQVDIEYERGALFQLDKKTLLGGRLEYQFGERNFIGLTALYHSRSTLDQRVRLGQEPIKNLIWDINTSLNFKPNFLTSIFDALPILETSAESRLKIEAEYAQVNPNPNTFNQPEIGDNDGVAFLDDFEGSRRFTSLGIQFRIWGAASAPARFRRLSDPTREFSVNDFRDRSEYLLAMDKTRLSLTDFNWFNPFDQVPTQSIWPDRDVTAQSGTTTNILNLRWKNEGISQDSAWAGIMRSTVTFSDQQKTKFIELWVRGDKGQVNIDIGRISEDWYVRGEFPDPTRGNLLVPSLGNLNNEDKNLNGLLDVDLGEDTGLDGVPGVDGQNVLNDAGDDDWVEPGATGIPFNRINGTENNSNAQGARFPDTEDLDGDGSLNTFNDYFSYSFNLADQTSPFLASQTTFENGVPTGWKLYRIPLTDTLFTVGNPDTTFQQIFNVRLWVNDLPIKPGDLDTLQIATFDFVSNEWEEEGFAANDTSDVKLDEESQERFAVTVYNTEEHSAPPVNYTSPPGVAGIRDRITGAVSKEQSLVLQLFDIPPEGRVETRKQFREKINLINYNQMKVFTYGNELDPEMGDSAFFFIRFGPTDQIYYEYRQLIYPGWDERNNVELEFDLLAKTKDDSFRVNRGDTLNSLPIYKRPDPNFPNKEFYVVGNPGLHNINYIIIGMKNGGQFDLVEREIWIDEMRITGVDRQSGTASRLSIDLGVADVASVRAQWELVDDNFRKLEQQFPSENGKDQTRQRQSYFASLRLHKFLPEGWGLDIPIDGKFTRTINVPKYFYNSDKRTNYDLKNVNDRLGAFFGYGTVDSSLADQITFSETRSLGGTLRRRDKNRDPWLLRVTLNQLVVDADYSDKHATSPTELFNDNTSISSRLSYQIPFGRDNFINPFGWMGKSKLLRFLTNMKLYYLPSAFSADMSLSDNETQRRNRLESDTTSSIDVKSSRKFNIGYKLTETLSFDFNRDYQSDPRLEANPDFDPQTAQPGDTIPAFITNESVRYRDVLNSIATEWNFGEDKRISQRFGVTYNPKLLSWLDGNYRYTSNFVYSLDRAQINSRSSTSNVGHTFHFDLRLSTLVRGIWSPKPKGRAAPGGRRTRGRPPNTRRRTGEGEQDQDEEKKDGSGFKIPNPLLLVWGFFDTFKTISVDIRQDDSYAHRNLQKVPVWQYQFGFDSDPMAGVDSSFNKAIVNPNIRSTFSVDGRTNLDLLNNLKISLIYNSQEAKTQSDEQTTRTKSNTVFINSDDPGDPDKQKFWWSFVPDWRISLSGLEKLPLIKKIARSASVEHSRNGKFSETIRIQGDVESQDNATYSNNFQPFIGFSLNTVWGVTANFRSNRSQSIDYRAAGATTRREQSSFNFSASYSVTKGLKLPIPFLKNKELKNEIQFALALDNSSNRNFSRRTVGEPFEELDTSSNFKFRPSVTYRFSQKVNGTAFFEQSSSSNKRTGTTKASEFGINVNIAIR